MSLMESFLAADNRFRWLESRQSGWQFGEQGVLLALYERLSNEIKLAAEIGAGDGESLPVTLEPLYHKLQSLMLYEKDPISRAKLARFDGPQGGRVQGEWDKHACQRRFGMVVIDVDSFDWMIFADFVGYGVRWPAVIMCEHRDFHKQNPGPLPSYKQCLAGEQATSQQLQQIAAGVMTLVGTTRCNSVFVRDDLLERVSHV